MPATSRKKDDVRTNGNGARVKLRWMELDVEGGTTDLVEGFKSFATTLRGTGVGLPTRSLTSPVPAGSASATTVIDDLPSAQEHEVDATGAEPVGADPTDTVPDNEVDIRKRRPAPRAPKFLGDLDLTKAAVQLNDFVQEKNPGGDMDKYAVIAAFFKQHLNTDEITIDHIFTAYKALGWQAQLPDDLSQTFRKSGYSSDEIDLLVVHIQPRDVWYVLPVEAFMPAKCLRFYPDIECKAARWEGFREAWAVGAE